MLDSRCYALLILDSTVVPAMLQLHQSKDYATSVSYFHCYFWNGGFSAIKECELPRMLPGDSLVLLKHVAARLDCCCGAFMTCTVACSWTRSFDQAEDAAGILFEEFSAAGYEVNELLPLLLQRLGS
ncbi:hypothetical protein Nepgr_016478 [Nepenthes gracilis]|uniref:Uncharacterized protein n=1 Tax=Nepenthes gracilis TaxID=150966 RepID=A0AAD3XRC9_NEPGR|nr:hypothetical protein Nepgr_016478 [Nepenthes gracilis]